MTPTVFTGRCWGGPLDGLWGFGGTLGMVAVAALCWLAVGREWPCDHWRCVWREA
jgi:hypothetical protein